VELASTQAISFNEAKRLSRAQRHAFVSVWNNIQERQEREIERRTPKKPQAPPKR
jgi:hypothetical protein